MSQTIKITYGNIMCPECYRGEMREITFASVSLYSFANMFDIYGIIVCPYCGTNFMISFDDFGKHMWLLNNIDKHYEISYGDD